MPLCPGLPAPARPLEQRARKGETERFHRRVLPRRRALRARASWPEQESHRAALERIELARLVLDLRRETGIELRIDDGLPAARATERGQRERNLFVVGVDEHENIVVDHRTAAL